MQMDVNLCIWSQMPCRFKPYLPFCPHMKCMGPHFMTAQLCSFGFSIHTNIMSIQPTQQLNWGVLFCMNPCGICCCFMWSMGNSILMSGALLMALTIAQIKLKNEVCPIPNNGKISYELPPAKKRIDTRSFVSRGMRPFSAVFFIH